MSNPVESVRDRLGAAIFSRIAGDEGPERRDRIHGEAGIRRFTSEDPIQIVHSDASMFIGGIRALLLQSLHPLAMAAVDQHSGFRGDPWGRLQRTSTFLAETTFGTEEMAKRAVDIVHAVHKRVVGTAPDGRPYEANDPHLLLWVHIAEIDSFLTAYDRYGDRTLTPSQRDTYVAQTAHVARMLGAEEPPTSVAELEACMDRFRPELRTTEAARRTARYLLIHPPVSLALRPGYTMLCAAAVGLMPRWTRLPLRLPYLPIAEATAVRATGAVATTAIRWMIRAPRVPEVTE